MLEAVWLKKKATSHNFHIFWAFPLFLHIVMKIFGMEVNCSFVTQTNSWLMMNNLFKIQLTASKKRNSCNHTLQQRTHGVQV